jgi:hypothetical protein
MSSERTDCDFDLDFHSGSEEDAPALVKGLEGEAGLGDDEEGLGGSTGTGEDERTRDSRVTCEEETRRGSTGETCGDGKGSTGGTGVDERTGRYTTTVQDERRLGFTGTGEDATIQDDETFAPIKVTKYSKPIQVREARRQVSPQHIEGGYDSLEPSDRARRHVSPQPFEEGYDALEPVGGGRRQVLPDSCGKLKDFQTPKKPSELSKENTGPIEESNRQGDYVNSGDSKITGEDDKRLDLANVGVSLQDYLRERVPLETKKSTDQAVRLYERVMASAANKQGKEFKSLKDTPLEDLPEALGQFIIIARKQNGDVFNASSLETYYQSLARYLSTEYEPKVDIKNAVNFKIVQQTLDRRCTEVAAQGGRPGKNASKPVSAETVQLAYKKGTLGRKNPRALVTSVHSIMMTGFGSRAIKEAYQVTNEDIIYGPAEQEGLPKWIELSERITKTRRGRKNEVRDVEGRIYLDNQHPEICPVRTFIEFQRRKTAQKNVPEKPFLLTVKQSAEANPEREMYWYTNCNGRMGENQIGRLFKQAFVAAGADVKAEKIQATSCRKNMAQGGADGMVPGEFLSKMLGQKNIDIVSFTTSLTRTKLIMLHQWS